MEKGFWDDPYRSSFSSVITAATLGEDGRATLELERTFFYPESGGQPSDKGKIAGHDVVKTRYADINHERVEHLVKADTLEGLEVGTEVLCKVDWRQRLKNMRSHTAGHIVFGAARRVFKTVEYAGFSIGEDETSSIYLKAGRTISSRDLVEVAMLANQAVVDDRDIRTSFMRRDKVEQSKDIIYTVDLDEIAGDQVRIVEIDGWDTSVCGGTHFSRTIEVGPILIKGRAGHKKNVTRVDYVVGDTAVRLKSAEESQLVELSELLGAPMRELVVRVGSLQTEIKRVNKIRELLEKKVGPQFLAELEEQALEIDGHRLVVGFSGGLGQGAIAALLSKRAKRAAALRLCVVGSENDPFFVLASSRELPMAPGLEERLKALVKEYRGKGGGSRTFFQARDLSTSEYSLKERLEKILTAA